MNQAPKVSVIIPTFNRGHLIERSIKSVLNQTYSNLELILVDDCSTDDTSKIAAEIIDSRFRYFKNGKNLGPSKSRNIGIELSSGELIAFQDSDDEWHLDKLEKQVALILNSPQEVAAVYCGMEFFDYKSRNKIGEDIREVNFRKIYSEGSFFMTPANVTVLIKKSVLSEVGPFDDKLFANEDTELAIRVTKKYRYAFVNEPLVKVLRNHNQLTGNAKNYTDSKVLIYEKHKNYLSQEILFGLCKEAANYYILKKDFNKARKIVRNALRHKMEIKTLLQYLALNFFPLIISFCYRKKYVLGIPHPNESGKYLPLNS